MNLLPHQIEAVERTVKMNGKQFLKHKTGTGKTLTALATYKYYKDKDASIKMLVVCPINLIEGAWIKEIEKVRRENNWHFKWQNLNNGDYYLDGEILKAKGFIWKAADILMVNYEYLMGDKKFNALMDVLTFGRWFCPLDESSCLKNHQSKTAERLLGWWDTDPNDKSKRPRKKFFEGIKQKCEIRQALSATPAPNIEWEWWTQMFWLDDKILDDNFYKFRNRTFELKRGKQVAPGAFMNKAQLRELQRTGFKYEVVKGEWEKCLDRMKPYVHVVESLAGMPDEIDEFTIIEMGEEQRKIYNQMKRDYVAEIKREIEGKDITNFAIANVALTKLLRLRQITSGFIKDENDNEIPIVNKNLKIEALLNRIEQYGTDQVIIWCQFKWEMNKLFQILTDLGGGVSIMNGDVDQKDRQPNCDAFESGANRFMIAHPKSMKFGFTFINCHYEDFFSLDASSLDYQQCRGRTARHGQKHPCVYNHILCKGTIDEDMYKIITGKMTAADVAERYLKGM